MKLTQLIQRRKEQFVWPPNGKSNSDYSICVLNILIEDLRAGRPLCTPLRMIYADLSPAELVSLDQRLERGD